MKNLLRILAMGGALLAFTLAPLAAQGQAAGSPLSFDSLPVGAAASPIGTAFAYRGMLSRNGSPYTGTCQFQFALWETAQEGDLAAAPLVLPAVAVSAGVYDVQLDFGAGAFEQARWLETTVECPGDAGPVTLPRQALLPVPYALHADSVDAANVAGLSAGTGLTYAAGQFSIGAGAVANDRLVYPGLTITAGAGLTGGGAVELGSTTTLSVDTTALQARVTGACAAGSYITAVHADGAVTCAVPAAPGPVLSGGVYTLTGGPATSR